MSRIMTDKTKENIARFIGAESYGALLKSSEKEIEKMVCRAKKTRRYRSKVSEPRFSVSGNPYAMIGRIIDREGKIVK